MLKKSFFVSKWVLYPFFGFLHMDLIKMQIPLVESRLALSYSSWFSDLGFAFFVRWLQVSALFDFGGMTMKKFLISTLVLLTMFCFVACNDTNTITCPKCGYENSSGVKSCSDCGASMVTVNDNGSSNGGNNNNTFCQHSYGEWSEKAAASCISTGTKERTCSKCTDKETETIPALGHTTTTGICERCDVRQGWTKNEVQSLVKVYSVFVDEINSAGGVDMKIAWENTSSKTIKYIYFTVEAYNAVDDKVYCEIGDYNEFTGYSTGPFETGYTNLLYDDWEDEYSIDTYWENCYYNSDIRYFVLTNIRIVYMDNTEENINKDYVDYSFADIPQGLVYTWNNEYNGYEVNYRLKNECTSTQIFIPETYNNEKVVAISDKAFHEIASIQKIILPNTIKSIGQRAFYECTNLSSINLPNTIKSIGSYAFSGCINLKNITLPNNLTYIETGLFSDCTSLSNVSIPYGVTSIDLHAFFGCENLTTVTIPNTVTSIGDGAFGQCTDLEYIIIPNSVKTMGYDVFSFSLNLTIYCQSSSEPSGWGYSWYYRVGKIVWGYTGN